MPNYSIGFMTTTDVLLAETATCEFELLRLVMVDSYTKGKITELPISGGTIITGRNGRGKTSLLQIILAFYGERPDRIVVPASNKVSFARYYLPRMTSYLVYEYRRRDVICCAVLYSDDTGDALRYRFIRSQYRQEFFVQPDLATIVMSRDLTAHLKQLGANTSRPMDLYEYRNIIQGRSGTGRDAHKQRAMVADFSFCPSGRQIAHIERIVSGMFLRRTNFTDLQRMVVASIAESANQISLGADRKRIDVWPDHYESYMSVMAQEPRMAAASSTYDTLLFEEQEIGRIHARLTLLVAKLQGDLTQALERRASAKRNIEAEETQYRDRARVFDEAIERAERAAQTADAEVRALDKRRDHYKQIDVDAKAALLGRESEIRHSKEALERRQQLLTGTAQNIATEYDRLLNEMNRLRLLDTAAASVARGEIIQSFIPRLAALESARDNEYRDLRTRAEGQLRSARDAVEAAQRAIGEAQAKVSNSQADNLTVKALEDKLVELKKLRTSLADERKQLKSRRDAARFAEKAYTREEQSRARLILERSRLTTVIEELLLRQAPSEDSLLYFLRTQLPGWHHDLAKVIREDLLVRTDLSPSIGSNSGGMYGLELDVDQLDAHLAADETALKEEILAATGRIKAIEADIAAADLLLDTAGAARHAALADEELQERKVGGIEQTIATKENEEVAARSLVEKSKASARTVAESTFAEAKEQLGTAKESVVVLETALQSALELRQRRYAKERAELAAEQAVATKVIDDAETGAARAHEARCQSIAQERTQKLSAAGVDVKALASLSDQLKQAFEEIALIESSRNLVAEWRLWLDKDWSRRSLLEKESVDARAIARERRDDKTLLQNAWDKRLPALKTEESQAVAQVQKLELEIGQIEKRRFLLDNYPPDEPTLGERVDPTWTLTSLTQALNQHQRAIQDTEKALAAAIAALKTAFVAHRGTPPDDFYISHRQQLGADESERARAWVPIFRSWYSGEHEAFRNTLRVEAAQIAGAISSFHQQMDRFHKQVVRFNASLQENLDANLGFESISRVTVKIVSTVHQLEYWPVIEKVANSQRIWIAGDGTDLPPPEFSATLRELLEHWEVRAGIRAELTHQISIQGEVIENGNLRTFRKAEDLETVSSNGLSYIVLCVIFIGFINRIRRGAAINVTWALDEIKDLDIGNVEVLMSVLRKNNITLVSACPDPDVDVLAMFKNRRSIRSDRVIYDPRGALAHRLTAPVGDEVLSDV